MHDYIGFIKEESPTYVKTVKHIDVLKDQRLLSYLEY